MAKNTFGKRGLALVLACIMMGNLLPMGAVAQNETPVMVENFEDTYYKQDGTAGTAEDWQIHLSKTAQYSGEENFFDITLTVETKDTQVQVAADTHGAAVLVLDLSNSMNTKEDTGCTHNGCEADKDDAVHCEKYVKRNSWKDQCKKCGKTEAAHDGHHKYIANQKTRLDSLKAAVADFLDTFASDAKAGEKRLVSVVGFGTKAKTIQAWVDVNDAAALAKLKTTINSLSTGDGAYLGKSYLFDGGTNMEGGLVLGRNLLQQSDILEGIPTENQSLILFSDGEPTAEVEEVSSTSVTDVSYGGIDVGYNTDADDYDDIEKILKAVSAAKIAVIYNYNDARGILKAPPFTRVINSSTASLAVDLKTEAGMVITNKTNATNVTDPMGPGVSLVTMTGAYNAASRQWDLSKIAPVVEDGVTTYTISYRVAVDPKAIELDENYPGYTVLTPANGVTTLNYTYGEDAEAVVVEFNVPNIRGIRSFTVSYEYVGEVPEDAPMVPADETYKAGASVQVAAAPSLENYTFSGWDKVDFVMSTQDVVIYGSWTENTKYDYTLLYNANFGEDETLPDAENVTGIYNDEFWMVVDENPFLREGYNFMAWNTAADGSGTTYAVYDVIGLAGEHNTVVLYALWERIVPPTTEPTVPPTTETTVPPTTQPPAPPVTEPPAPPTTVPTVPPTTEATVPPTTQPPVTEPPVTEPPVTEPPVTEPPVTEPPVTEPPVTEPPVTEPPVTEPPVTEPPVTEPPVTEPPVTEPPATEPAVVELPDEDVPLAGNPQTGDPTFLLAGLAVASGSGLLWLKGKKKEEEE